MPTRPTALGVLGGASDFGVRAELGRVLEPRFGSPGHIGLQMVALHQAGTHTTTEIAGLFGVARFPV